MIDHPTAAAVKGQYLLVIDYSRMALARGAFLSHLESCYSVGEASIFR